MQYFTFHSSQFHYSLLLFSVLLFFLFLSRFLTLRFVYILLFVRSRVSLNSYIFTHCAESNVSKYSSVILNKMKTICSEYFSFNVRVVICTARWTVYLIVFPFLSLFLFENKKKKTNRTFSLLKLLINKIKHSGLFFLFIIINIIPILFLLYLF